MGFFSKWVNQAKRIDWLERELDFTQRAKTELENFLNREEEKNALLESALSTERKELKQTLRRVADQAVKQIGLPQTYIKDAEKSESVNPPPPDKDEPSEWVLWQANEQRKADEEAGIEPAPLEHYIKVLQEHPNRFVIG
jgi:DNA-directed RNA polymerase specialized sigma54-like protein